MDTSRAKNIMIVLLLLLNIFMLWRIIVYATGETIPSDTIQNTIDILKSRNVQLECRIPLYEKDTPKLQYAGSDLDRKMVADKLLGGTFDTETGNLITKGSKELDFDSSGEISYKDTSPQQQLDLSKISFADRYVRSFVKGTGILDNTYVLDRSDANSDGSLSLYYVEKYNGFLVFDNKLNVKVTKNGIVSLECSRRKLQGLTSDKASDIAAAYQILLGPSCASFFEARKSTVITRIDFGFLNYDAAMMKDTETYQQFPVWRIVIKGLDEPLYFNASDGKQIGLDSQKSN